MRTKMGESTRPVKETKISTTTQELEGINSKTNEEKQNSTHSMLSLFQQHRPNPSTKQNDKNLDDIAIDEPELGVTSSKDIKHKRIRVKEAQIKESIGWDTVRINLSQIERPVHVTDIKKKT